MINLHVLTKIISFETEGEITIVDLTQMLESFVKESEIINGVLSANVIGSTGALTTIEYESRVLDDFRNILILVNFK